jgi:hypothetical protein
MGLVPGGEEGESVRDDGLAQGSTGLGYDDDLRKRIQEVGGIEVVRWVPRRSRASGGELGARG